MYMYMYIGGDGREICIGEEREMYTHIYIYIHTYLAFLLFIPKNTRVVSFGVATISRLLKNIGLFCKRSLQQRPIVHTRDLWF